MAYLEGVIALEVCHIAQMKKRKKSESNRDIQFRLQLIEEVDKCGSQSKVSKARSIPKSTISDWVKNRAEYEQLRDRGEDLSCNRICHDPFTLEVHTRIINWFNYFRERGGYPTDDMIQTKAQLVAASIDPTREFKASSGWLQNWKNKYGIKCRKLCGESRSVPQHLVDNWVSNISTVTEGYSLDCIYNCDESGIFFRSLPDRCLVAPSDNKKNAKSSKERLTCLFTVSATGEKLIPLIIGKAKNPRGFTQQTRSGIHYYYNQKAWMNQNIFSDYLSKLNILMRSRNKKILLLMDNAPVHGTGEYSHLKILKLPPNTTASTQPLDAGIIRNFKIFYRKQYLSHLLSSVDDDVNAEEASKKINVAMSLEWLKIAWNRVTAQTICNCWRKVGFNPVADVEIIGAGELEEIDEEFREMANQLAIPNPELMIDDVIEICEANGEVENEILFPNTVPVPEVVVDSSDEEGVRTPPSLKAMKSYWNSLREGVLHHGEGDEEAMKLISDFNKFLARLTMKGGPKQSTLDNFLCTKSNTSEI